MSDADSGRADSGHGDGDNVDKVDVNKKYTDEELAGMTREQLLETNDSLYFDASASHQLVNAGTRVCKVLSVSSK